MAHRPEDSRACNDSVVLCGLQPYTEYEVGVECKNLNYSGIDFGLWSETNSVVEWTDEDGKCFLNP